MTESSGKTSNSSNSSKTSNSSKPSKTSKPSKPSKTSNSSKPSTTSTPSTLSTLSTSENTGDTATSWPARDPAPLSEPALAQIDAWWRAANYLSVGQIYLLDNPLLREPLTRDHIKPRLLGHFGTVPGLNLVYAHLNRAIRERRISTLYVTGPGHGGPGMVANAYLEGTYSEIYAHIDESVDGMRKLFRQFSFPGGIPSHVSPDTPGSINEGGELGYSLSHAYGAAFDNPDLLVACVIGDGEAETGPLATSWHSNKFINPRQDGVVLPILHLNGYKIANPAVLARIPEEELVDLMWGCGYKPHIVSGGFDGEDPLLVHQRMAETLDVVLNEIAEIKRHAREQNENQATDAAGRPGRDGATDAAGRASARSSAGDRAGQDQAVRDAGARPSAGAPEIAAEFEAERPRFPMIILRTPKGWTCPAEIDGLPVEDTWRAHQVPLPNARDSEEHTRILENWMKKYRPEELFDDSGKLRPDVAALAPEGELRMSANPHANGGVLRQPLRLPDFRDYGVDVPEPGATTAEATKVLGGWLADVIRDNPHNFRIFGPDETASNRLAPAVYEYTGKQWNAEIWPVDKNLQPTGRVMEMLSEHQCEGWLEGYLLTGRHGLFNCYEAFIHIVDSMFNQHAKWLEACREIPWRRPVASLNYLLSSHVWRQDHNGFSHQDPGFIDVVMNKKSEIVRVYLPPDTNTLLSTYDHCLRSTDYVNVVVAGKQPQANWLTMDEAIAHCTRGIGIWEWAGTEHTGAEHTGAGHAPTDLVARGPDVVLACAGDVPTLEALAAASILRSVLPGLAVRFVNVVDLMRLHDPREHPHGLADAEFDAIFTTDKPVIFAYHGYPWLIHRLTYRRRGHDNLHVRGYKENGTTTTPFDMVMMNDLDRYRLVMDVIDRVPGLGSRAAALRQRMQDARLHARQYTREHGEDIPEVAEWAWGNGGVGVSQEDAEETVSEVGSRRGSRSGSRTGTRYDSTGGDNV
jgi:xylulose-5-phosphate/fructose-6-phosphate phosphoketolase